MMETNIDRKLRAVIVSFFIVFLALIVLFAYIYVSSALAHKHYQGITADMYGLSNLYYEGDTVMNIYVWQGVVQKRSVRATKDRSAVNVVVDYELKQLNLVPGVTVITMKDPFKKPEAVTDEFANLKKIGDVDDVKLTVAYEGELYGEYEYAMMDEVKYGSVSELGQDFLVDVSELVNAADMESQPDGTFSGHDMMSLSINAHMNHINAADRRGEEYLPVENYREATGKDMKDSIHREYLKNVYPEAPFVFREMYRDVMSTRLTIHAVDPKDGSIRATAELVIRQLSEWRNIDNLSRGFLESLRFYPSGYSEILVVSYTQSDAGNVPIDQLDPAGNPAS